MYSTQGGIVVTRTVQILYHNILKGNRKNYFALEYHNMLKGNKKILFCLIDDRRFNYKSIYHCLTKM